MTHRDWEELREKREKWDRRVNILMFLAAVAVMAAIMVMCYLWGWV